MKVILLTSAEEDLVDAWHFYDDQETGVGEYYYDEVMTAVQSPSTQYGLHPSKGQFFRALVPKFHTAIYYPLEPDFVLVRRILALRRDPKWLRRQLRN
jgi:plasmid stabilization system protein ParE